jgi:D-3-phosphoglycerate dehydrogenase / 2-oxoglutarate reductase
LAHDPFLSPDAVTLFESQAALVPLDELLAQSHAVSCHLPGGPQTRGLLDAATFRQMRPGAYFMNASRGEVVDEEALLEALQAGRIAGAALDVRIQEPPLLDRLEAMENVILTPHIGAFTNEAQERVIAAVGRDVAAVLSGGSATHFVNFPSPRSPAPGG